MNSKELLNNITKQMYNLDIDYFINKLFENNSLKYNDFSNINIPYNISHNYKIYSEESYYTNI